MTATATSTTPAQQGVGLRDLFSDHGVKLSPQLAEFPGFAAGAQLARMTNDSTSTGILSRATALWSLIELAPEVDEALAKAGLSHHRFSGGLGLSNVSVEPLAVDDVPVRPTLADAINRYFSEQEHPRDVVAADLALAILRAAVASPLSGKLGKRLDDAGCSVVAAIELLEAILAGKPRKQKLRPEPRPEPHPGPDPDPIARLGLPSLALLADRPLDDEKGDLLDFDPYACAIATLIDNPKTDTPFTIAINAPWGAGKTSLANMVVNRLNERSESREDPPHIVYRFNAWQHDDAPHLGSSFAADVARQADQHRPLLRRLVRPLPRRMLDSSGRWRRDLSLAGGVAVLLAIIVLLMAALVGPGEMGEAIGVEGGEAAGGGLADISLWESLRALFGFGTTVAVGTGALTALSAGLSAAKATASFVSDPESASGAGSMKEVGTQLGDLIGEALSAKSAVGTRRFVIFVDDLERCTPPQAIEVCQVASLLLAHPDVVTVLLADMSAVAASAEVKYEKLAKHYHARNGVNSDHPRSSADGDTTEAPGEYGRLFLQKIVQFRFDLPLPRPSRTSELAAALVESAREAELAEEHDERDTEPDRLPRAQVMAFLNRHRLAIFRTTVFVLAIGLAIGAVTLGSFIASVSAAAVLAIGAVACTVRWWMARRARRLAADKAKGLDDEFTRLRKEGKTDPDVVRSELAKWSERAGVPDGLVEQRTEQFLTDDSTLSKEAGSVIMEYLPPLPRAAKRMLNRLRFLMVIAIRRELLDGHNVTARHLGKWVVLMERWPDLSEAIIQQPELATQLEALAAHDDADALSNELKRINPYLEKDADLRRFLEQRPSLGVAAENLVYFEPASA